MNHSHLRTRARYWWDDSVCKISSKSDYPLKSYRVYGRTDTLIDSIVYSLFEYTKTLLWPKKFRQFDQNQSVGNYFLLFEVHITLGFKSEVSTFIRNLITKIILIINVVTSDLNPSVMCTSKSKKLLTTDWFWSNCLK
jgi:hypothetical protein